MRSSRRLRQNIAACLWVSVVASVRDQRTHRREWPERAGYCGFSATNRTRAFLREIPRRVILDRLVTDYPQPSECSGEFLGLEADLFRRIGESFSDEQPTGL